MCDQEIDFMNSFYKKEDHSSNRRRKDFLFVFLSLLRDFMKLISLLLSPLPGWWVVAVKICGSLGI